MSRILIYNQILTNWYRQEIDNNTNTIRKSRIYDSSSDDDIVNDIVHDNDHDNIALIDIPRKTPLDKGICVVYYLIIYLIIYLTFYLKHENQ